MAILLSRVFDPTKSSVCDNASDSNSNIGCRLQERPPKQI